MQDNRFIFDPVLDEITKYSDIDLNFIPNPFTRDVVELTNVNAIRKSVLNVVKYSRYEMPNSASMVSIYDYLFEQSNHIVINSIRDKMIFTIEKYEKRVKVRNIDVDFVENIGIRISIYYTILPLKIDDVINYTVKRVN